ncbi:modification methylase EcaI [Sphingobium sp. 22B]|uniref:site-specific DNA-methyltransferase n=1 Tax=unclassified Sphingobium TaxID=2611147 RepID=UPI0007857639|nr:MULTISPECIES: DNA methyltransferase [unclassified Sphingobium]KXU30972.1 modification methylase EcaI [Sphingobium sp. AM]KYC31776.1 modification methylase EcaI [Sphingobium sp. 22B]OAP31098.1 modification methylase EcaI [Sphingobium sp. 20006FA]
MNRLYFGDNLDVLRKHIPDETIQLIYLDPPFNSKATYNILYKSPVGADAQRKAFEDTWRWEDGAEEAMDQVRIRDIKVFKMLRSLRDFLGESDLMAYLAMMTVRLIEMRRVLKPTGTLYLHCDPTASHYLKAVLDGIFGVENYRNEIIWKRTSSHNDAAQGLSRYGRTHDVILFYGRGAGGVWNLQYSDYSDGYKKQHYSNVMPDGRRYKTSDLTAAKPGGDVSYEWKGVRPPTGRYWAYSRANMERFEKEGRLQYAAKSGMPRLRHFLDEMPGVPLSDMWDDISPVNSQAKERIGYPTQKPLALLERIIKASSNPGDLILDPFCGCGTAIHAAERQGRQWIGIDVTFLAIQVIQDRIKSWLPHAKYDVDGIPKDEFAGRQLARLDPFTFQEWAVGRVGGQSRGKGPDRGIDGEIAFLLGPRKYGHGIVSVKAGRQVGPDAVRVLKSVVERERADLGVLVCLDNPTTEMRKEAAIAGRIDLPGGSRSKIQILTIKDLIAGPNLGILTELNAVQAAQEAKAARRRTKPAAPTPEQLRREPQLPPMPITGGKTNAQLPMDLQEPLLVTPVMRKRKKAQ